MEFKERIKTLETNNRVLKRALTNAEVKATALNVKCIKLQEELNQLKK